MDEEKRVMDKLSLAKIAEHEPHGWQVVSDLYAVSNSVKIPGYWMACSCGWTGWVMKDPDRQPVEKYEDMF